MLNSSHKAVVRPQNTCTKKHKTYKLPLQFWLVAVFYQHGEFQLVIEFLQLAKRGIVQVETHEGRNPLGTHVGEQVQYALAPPAGHVGNGIIVKPVQRGTGAIVHRSRELLLEHLAVLFDFALLADQRQFPQIWIYKISFVKNSTDRKDPSHPLYNLDTVPQQRLLHSCNPNSYTYNRHTKQPKDVSLYYSPNDSHNRKQIFLHQ